MAIELSDKQIKDGWQIVKFGEIAKNISKRVEPSETDLEVYVGLEHIDPQSLRIARRGVPADVKGQKLRVRPGQIIFGKRRAYQKKVAVADFEGICSAHAMVLEEVVGKIIPGLLPFFMQSDMFMDRAVAISEGSLSPTIKWKALAIQEFPLPPIERQKEILEVLEKVEEAISRSEVAFDSAKILRKAIRSNFLFKGCTIKQTEKTHWGEVPKGWKIQPLSEMAQINPRYTLAKSEPIQFCEMAAVGNDSMSIEGEIETREKVSGGARFKNKDILFARITPCAENGKITIVDFLKEDSVGVGSTEFIVISPRKTSSEYLYHLCRTNRVHGYAIKRMAGTTGRQRIPNEVFDEIMIPIPPSEGMSIIEEQLHNAEKTVISIESKISRMKMLRTSFFNEVFIGGVQ
ncbi:restriction endonuclease subunit S [Desulfobacter hydrogenophilus]|uniref:Restriction endonuclease subunit S n=1 Tax=Desulfobacter hydrogenophilus TaxID=2291 RepID=A0A328FGE0_9BACT|nr:restriction endonuclease subunit S [Desulfobacter hydrogenophilus]NDY71472.1 restriction endonuclease subunit S [Desulfobacter hydrogenophilus]QBH12207.1 restriction endonuclease subunit S [Desulfobacter hydrogenophilus]RAM03469.1 restriction endonuclease subunit S [Desulfobacter hydrogenophilus]